MRLALAQMRMENSIGENLQKSLRAIEEAANEKADLILFPELQLSPFFPQYEKRNAREFLLTAGHECIQKLAEQCGNFHIMASPNLYLQENGQNYDVSLFINVDGRIQGVSKMVHIMQSRYFYEQDYYTPSDDGFKVYDSPHGKIGIVICFDRHLPESIRTCAALGADLILISTANIEGEPLEAFEWELRVQAMQSSVAIAMCNRVGREDEMNFIGQSIVIDPGGDVLAKADNRERILYADIDCMRNSHIRNMNPCFALRRLDCYL